MTNLHQIGTELLLEQDSKLEIIRKSITERIPMSIYYRGPANEVREGQRIDIEPIVMGRHITSGNLVIWAYVFKGISKKGLPGWKMFRVDRINSAKLNYDLKNFNLSDLPEYERGKAPDSMKSLSSVEIYSPYWFEGEQRPEPERPAPERPAPEVEPPQPEVAPPAEIEPIQKPEISSKKALERIYGDLKRKITNIEGQQFINRNDYDLAIKDLYSSKESEFKKYQRAIGANQRPGEGTRERFANTSKSDIDKLLNRDKIQINDNPEMIQEGYRITNRIKQLIKW